MTAVQSLRSKALLSQIEGDRCAVSFVFVSQDHPHLCLLFQFTVSIGTSASGQGRRACSPAPVPLYLGLAKKAQTECPGCLGSVLTPTRQYSELPAGSFPRASLAPRPAPASSEPAWRPCPSAEPPEDLACLCSVTRGPAAVV